MRGVPQRTKIALSRAQTSAKTQQESPINALATITGIFIRSRSLLKVNGVFSRLRRILLPSFVEINPIVLSVDLLNKQPVNHQANRVTIKSTKQQNRTTSQLTNHTTNNPTKEPDISERRWWRPKTELKGDISKSVRCVKKKKKSNITKVIHEVYLYYVLL